MPKNIISGPSEGERLELMGETMRILVDGEASGGTLVQFEEISRPGGGPPLHIHAKDDESFLVLEGRMKFSIDGKESVHGPGSYIFAPRGSKHTFCNIGPGPSRMIISCTPSGLEEAFRETAKLEAAGKVNMQAIDAAFARIGVTFIGPPLKP